MAHDQVANPRRGRSAQRRLRRWLAAGLGVIGAGCSSAQLEASQADAAVAEPEASEQSFEGPDGRPKLCQREVESSDAIRELFCGDVAPEIGSLDDLVQALINPIFQGRLNTVPFPIMLGHSTSLSGHQVSSINPRAIMITSAGGGPLLTFTRGVQQVEAAAMSRDQKTRRFYLLRFEQACNEQPEGCRPGDLYTPQIERDWLHVELAEDEDLKNTPADCRQCHQRARSQPTLLMRELVPPWTHFFEPISQEPGLRSLPGVLNSALARDYDAAKGTELYAGVDVAKLSPAAGSLLQATVGADQPVIFSSQEILNERWPRQPDGAFPPEPVPSQLWETGYAAFKRGEQLALPYIEQRATDPDKLAARTAAYAAYRAGMLDAADLPDFADVFPDDPLQRARMGLQTEPGASAVDTLIQGCGACHNDVLDQTLTRARFNIDLSRMSSEELDRAIARIERAPEKAGVMPPTEARQLDPAAKQTLLEYLRRDARSGEPVTALVHAAQVGMTGGARLLREADGQ
jgi:cytochrome c553